MNKGTHFRVDPKLTQIFGENYTSSIGRCVHLFSATGTAN